MLQKQGYPKWFWNIDAQQVTLVVEKYCVIEYNGEIFWFSDTN